MNFGNLEKIEELILRPAKNFSIKNTVILGRRNLKTGNRIDCFKEDCYKSNKYNNYKYVGNLYIESSDFLVFSFKDDITNKTVEIYSSYQHIQKIRDAFNTILEDLDDAFDIIDDGSIKLKHEYDNYEIKIKNLVNNHSISMVFDVLNNENDVNNKFSRAVTIFFNDANIYTTITDEDLSGITYFINNFNLLSSSQHLKQMAYMQQIAYALELNNIEMLPTEFVTESGGKINDEIKRNFKKRFSISETEEVY